MRFNSSAWNVIFLPVAICSFVVMGCGKSATEDSSSAKGNASSRPIGNRTKSEGTVGKTGAKKTDGGSMEFEMPKFPIPVPSPSAQMVFAIDQIVQPDSEMLRLADVDIALREAIKDVGYPQISYFYVPNGFALVTHVERITEDGAPIESDRFSSNPKKNTEFSIFNFLLAKPGYYRVVVFIVTDKPLTKTYAPGIRTAKKWLIEGTSMLPPRLGRFPISKDHVCTALIYEFRQPDTDQKIEPAMLGISVKKHLESIDVWKKLLK